MNEQTDVVVVMVAKHLIDQDETRRWISDILIAASEPVSGAWVFTDNAAEHMLSAAYTILQGDI